MIQFITDYGANMPIVDQVECVINAGCRWVEVRMDGATDEEIAETINKIKPLCLKTETFLILSGHVELAKLLDVGGVHLRHNDMLPSKARLALGPAAVIGISAHTYEDIHAVSSLDIDYIALEPFKEGPQPLGIDGTAKLLKEMKDNQIETATVAEGGVDSKDIDQLLPLGVNGIALCECIARSKEPFQKMEKIINRIK